MLTLINMGTLVMELDLIEDQVFRKNNNQKDILVLGKGPTQGLEHTLTAEKMYSINFTEKNKKF